MTLEPSSNPHRNLNGFSRSATEQALENLAQALRALELAPRSDSELCPHPLIIVRAEIENARRYLTGQTGSSRPRREAASRSSEYPQFAAA